MRVFVVYLSGCPWTASVVTLLKQMKGKVSCRNPHTMIVPFGKKKVKFEFIEFPTQTPEKKLIERIISKKITSFPTIVKLDGTKFNGKRSEKTLTKFIKS